jgi:hypothetical protein
MKSLNKFINEFEAGFQFNNRFACRIQLPRELLESGFTLSDKKAVEWLNRGILCESTNLPDRAFAETQMTQYGLTEQFPIHSEFTTLDCTFNTPLIVVQSSDGRSAGQMDNPVPRVFHAWQNLIQDMSTGYDSSRDFTFSGTSSDNGYYGEIEIAVFDRLNTPTLLYSFERAYPRVIQSTPVTWREENELARLTVGFTFSVWRVVPLSDTKTRAAWFMDEEVLQGRGFGSGPFQNNQMSYPGSYGHPGEFQNPMFRPSRSMIGGILTGMASDIIYDVTKGRVRIG